MSLDEKIVELLAKMSIKLDRHEHFFEVLQDIALKQQEIAKSQTQILEKNSITLDKHNTILESQGDILHNLEKINRRQEKLLTRILEVLSEDIIRYEEILDVEHFDGGKRIVLHKSKFSSNAL